MPSAKHYSSPEQVIVFTGVRPVDLGLPDDQALRQTIVGWLIGIKDVIDRHQNRDYHKEERVPPGINQIALRAAANLVAVAILRRGTPVITHEDFTIHMVDDKVFTPAILRDLAVFPPMPRFRLVVA